MPTALKTEVLIVGAGPTGLSLAAQLMRYGVDFIICDKKEDVTTLSKALVVHARSLEIYDQLGLADAAIEGGQIAHKIALLRHGKVNAELKVTEFGGQLSPFPYVLIFEQSRNESLLYTHLQSGGHEVKWQTELQSLTQSETGATAVLQTLDGNLETIEAQYVVGCDGASSTTRHLLELGFEGSTFPRLFYVADINASFKAEEAVAYAAFSDNAFALMFPIQGENHWRLLGNMPEYDPHPNAEQEPSYEEVVNKAQSIFQRPLEITSTKWFSTYKVHTRHAAQFSKGRCFLAGDAAHVHTPAGGQGMNTGIQDSYNLGWKLAMVLKGHAHAALLHTYNEERLANAKRLLRTTDQFFEVMAGDTWYQRFFRKDVMPKLVNVVSQFGPTKEFIFPTLSQIGIHYRENSLSQHEGEHPFEVKAGDRMPYFKVDGENVFDRLRAPKFHLLAFSDGQDSYEHLKELESTRGDWLDVQVLPLLPRVVDLFGTDKPFTVLLRPDNYIAFLSADFSAEMLDSYFSSLSSLTPSPPSL